MSRSGRDVCKRDGETRRRRKGSRFFGANPISGDTEITFDGARRASLDFSSRDRRARELPAREKYVKQARVKITFFSQTFLSTRKHARSSRKLENFFRFNTSRFLTNILHIHTRCLIKSCLKSSPIFQIFLCKSLERNIFQILQLSKTSFFYMHFLMLFTHAKQKHKVTY